MTHKVVPMIHVPDVRATAAWYETIGFATTGLHVEDDGEMTWARVELGTTEVMFSAGGKPSSAFRREVDLYVHVEDLDVVRASLPADVDVFEDVHDTEYGMRELIIRDCNRFWITFGQPMATSETRA